MNYELLQTMYSAGVRKVYLTETAIQNLRKETTQLYTPAGIVEVEPGQLATIAGIKVFKEQE